MKNTWNVIPVAVVWGECKGRTKQMLIARDCNWTLSFAKILKQVKVFWHGPYTHTKQLDPQLT